MFGLSYLRLGLYAAALLAILAAIWFEVSVHKKAARVEAAEAALIAYRAEVAARDAEAEQDRTADEQRRATLALRVEGLKAELEAIRNRPQKPLVVYREKIVNGAPCPDARLGDDFAELWNEAADAASRAVLAPD